MNKCHFCDSPAEWQIMSSRVVAEKVLDGKWTLVRKDRKTAAQVCEEHLIRRLFDNSAYHLVYRLGDGLGPDSFDWAVLIEECHKRNQELYDRETFL